jgi:NAD dependent epimerase/dehydratase
MRKKVLVTGSDGFIGSHLVEKLVDIGCEVTALVYYNSLGSWGWLDHIPTEILKKVNVISGDIRDYHFLKGIMKDTEIVFHLAALIGIPFSYKSPNLYVDTNIKGTLNVLNSALEVGVDKVIHTSTSEVYGSAQYVPIDEDHPLIGQSPYSATKIAADKLAESYFTSYNLPVAIIRPFNTYGPRQSARAIIPTIISQALGGYDIILGSKEPTRDFTYVSDTVTGFIEVAKSVKSIGQVINVGSGFEISIGDLAKKIVSQIDVNLKIITDESRYRPGKSEVLRLWADTGKAEKLLDFRTSHSLDEGIKKTIEWFKNGDNLSFYKSQIYNI